MAGNKPNPDQQSSDRTFAPPSMSDTPELVTSEESELITFGNQGSMPIIFPEGATTADAVSILSRNIPINEFGLPTYYYRSDMFPQIGTNFSHDDLEHAIVPLHYLEGYPASSLGVAFWNQMPHEGLADYLLFKRFIDQAEVEGIRQLDLLADTEKTALSKIRSLYEEYYWSSRARAYDLFVAAADQKRREHRIRNAENTHFTTADRMLTQLMGKFNEADWWEGLSTEAALEAMERLIKIQRLSLGLTGASASTRDPNFQAGTTAEIILRQMTKNIGLNEGAQQGFGAKLKQLMANPEDAMQLQELILRTTTHS